MCGGHLFRGRYKALLDGERDLPELLRYVHLNPVQAGLVGNPADWPWNGHRAYLGEERLAWLTTDRGLALGWVSIANLGAKWPGGCAIVRPGVTSCPQSGRAGRGA